MAPRQRRQLGDDMDWVFHSLKFRLISPIHIGYRKVGNLMQTRPYVPGKNLWAALTARLTRDFHDGSKGNEYRKVGDLVQDSFRFGYLWPSLDGRDPYLPWDHNDFDYLLLGSYASTALDYGLCAAMQGSLHEVEFISPHSRDSRPVHLIGDLWVKESLPEDLQGWKDAIRKLQLGGERSYGWGRLTSRSDLGVGRRGHGKTVAGLEWQEVGRDVQVALNEGDRITAHALASGKGRVPGLEGRIEPVVGRDWDEHAGQSVPFERVHYLPGSKVKRAADVKIWKHGRWAFCEGKDDIDLD
jgi:hypothetical protein